jgi:hypothetical protein
MQELTREEWDEIARRLREPFEPADVDFRVQGKASEQTGKAQVVCYIDARAVQDRLDRVVGSGNWSFDWQPLVIDKSEVMVAKGIITIYGVSKSDAGSASTFEQSLGAVSHCFKRAAVHWGIGRYLYNLPMAWVAVERGGRIPEPVLRELRSKLPRPSASTGRLTTLRDTEVRDTEVTEQESSSSTNGSADTSPSTAATPAPAQPAIVQPAAPSVAPTERTSNAASSGDPRRVLLKDNPALKAKVDEIAHDAPDFLRWAIKTHFPPLVGKFIQSATEVQGRSLVDNRPAWYAEWLKTQPTKGPDDDGAGQRGGTPAASSAQPEMAAPAVNGHVALPSPAASSSPGAAARKPTTASKARTESSPAAPLATIRPKAAAPAPTAAPTAPTQDAATADLPRPPFENPDDNLANPNRPDGISTLEFTEIQRTARGLYGDDPDSRHAHMVRRILSKVKTWDPKVKGQRMQDLWTYEDYVEAKGLLTAYKLELSPRENLRRLTGEIVEADPDDEPESTEATLSMATAS